MENVIEYMMGVQILDEKDFMNQKNDGKKSSFHRYAYFSPDRRSSCAKSVEQSSVNTQIADQPTQDVFIHSNAL